MTFISIVTPCFNEEDNVLELYTRIQAVMSDQSYTYEHIFIDNASTDRTVDMLRALAAEDKRVKVILNTRNFGHIRSPYYGLLQASGDAIIVMASDLQDPPEKIPEFIRKWEAGYKVVIGVKTKQRRIRFVLFFASAVLSNTSEIVRCALDRKFHRLWPVRQASH